MLPIDAQAEIILSFQQEKRQTFLEMRERERKAAACRPSWRARLLQSSGDALITTGRGLQRMSGMARSTDFERGKLGEVA